MSKRRLQRWLSQEPIPPPPGRASATRARGYPNLEQSPTKPRAPEPYTPPTRDYTPLRTFKKKNIFNTLSGFI